MTQAYSFGLLQLLCELLHSLGVFLSHLVYLGLVRPVLVIDGFFQQVHLLLTFCPAEQMDGSRINLVVCSSRSYKNINVI